MSINLSPLVHGAVFLAFMVGPHKTFRMNSFVRRYLKIIEMVGVLMRVVGFSLVSWMGNKSPFLFVWIFNTIAAVILTWCSSLKRDHAYVILNTFWILVGAIGILRATNVIH